MRENVGRYRPEFWRQNNRMSHHDAPCHTSFFYQGIFTKHNNTVALTFLTFLKMKGRHFGTTEVIEVESQAVLNTLTERGFQEEFQKWHKIWEHCVRAEWDFFEDGGCQ
jgi:hypothetical protein